VCAQKHILHDPDEPSIDAASGPCFWWITVVMKAANSMLSSINIISSRGAEITVPRAVYAA
jgi:hypothetical protein